MKKIVILALALILTLSVFACGKPADPSESPDVTSPAGDISGNNERKTTPEPEPSESKEMLIETLFELPYYVIKNSAERDANADKPAFFCDTGEVEVYSCPEGFCITDKEELLVLDTYGKFIRLYDLETGEQIKSVDIGEVYRPKSIAHIGGTTYVLDNIEGFIYTFDADYKALDKIPVSTDIYKLIEHNGSLILLGYNTNRILKDGEVTHLDTFNYYDYASDGGKQRIMLGEYSWEIEESAAIDYLKSDDEGNLYAFCFVNGDGDTMRIYDKYSRLVCSFEFDITDGIALPESYVYIDDDFNIYFMQAYESGLRIMKAVDAE